MQELSKSDAADFNPHTEMSTNREISLVFHKPHYSKPDNRYYDFNKKLRWLWKQKLRKVQ